MKTMKKTMGFYLNIVTGIAALVALVSFIIMSGDGQTVPYLVYLFAVGALAVQGLRLVLCIQKGEGLFTDILDIVITIGYALALFVLVQGRMGVVVNIFANHVGSVGLPMILAAVGFLAATILQMITGFMAINKEEK